MSLVVRIINGLFVDDAMHSEEMLVLVLGLFNAISSSHEAYLQYMFCQHLACHEEEIFGPFLCPQQSLPARMVAQVAFHVDFLSHSLQQET